MSKKRRHHTITAPRGAEVGQEVRPGPSTEAFTFGEPEPIDRASLLDYTQILRTGQWYEPPISLRGLANMIGVAPHHASALYLKRNLLVESFIPTKYLSTREFAPLALDFVTLANGYLQRADSIGGYLLKLSRVPALQTRVGLEPGDFWWTPESSASVKFDRGSIVHLYDVDVRQEIYGVPEYVSALQAVQLNRAAALFRRKYYQNGSHAGFILSLTDAAQDPKDIDALRKALRDSKGPGKFRNLFLYTPGGSKDGVKVIPISEVGARDDFAAIKNTSRDDMLAAHRVPPQLLGVVPNNAGEFGDVEKARQAFVRTEIKPIQARMMSLNKTWASRPCASRTPTTTPSRSQQNSCIQQNSCYNDFAPTEGGGMKYSEFRRWLKQQGVVFARSSGSSHHLLRYNGKTSVFADHGSKEMKEPVRKKILKDLGL